jgi:hypothetical protein
LDKGKQARLQCLVFWGKLLSKPPFAFAKTLLFGSTRPTFAPIFTLSKPDHLARKHMKSAVHSFLLLALASLAACAVRPRGTFDTAKVPPAPDYSNLDNWAAHPDKKDFADRTPLPSIREAQADAPADIIFLYPTTYTGSSRHERAWNAAVGDSKTNSKTDQTTILFQASIFNGAGRVFAPRYRQAHLQIFFKDKNTPSARAAYELAYTDVEAAFRYYLEHWNGGRPFIIAAHSQGAGHAKTLLRKWVEGKPLQNQLVAAYIVGWPVERDYFKALQPCETPEQTGCYCTWRTWERDSGRRRKPAPDIVCTNPLLWTTTEGQYAPASLNLGGVVRPFAKTYPAITDAEVCQGLLLAKRPKFQGSFFFRRKNYHIGDLNLYYLNVRANAECRARAFVRK